MAQGARAKSGGILPALIVCCLAAMFAVLLHEGLAATQWVKSFTTSPGETMVRTVRQFFPIRTVTVCDKSDAGGQRVILTSYHEQFVIADEVSYGWLIGGETLTGAEAYDLLERGKAYKLGIRSVPVFNWNTEVGSIGKPSEPPAPEACPN